MRWFKCGGRKASKTSRWVGEWVGVCVGRVGREASPLSRRTCQVNMNPFLCFSLSLCVHLIPSPPIILSMQCDIRVHPGRDGPQAQSVYAGAAGQPVREGRRGHTRRNHAHRRSGTYPDLTWCSAAVDVKCPPHPIPITYCNKSVSNVFCLVCVDCIPQDNLILESSPLLNLWAGRSLVGNKLHGREGRNSTTHTKHIMCCAVLCCAVVFSAVCLLLGHPITPLFNSWMLSWLKSDAALQATGGETVITAILTNPSAPQEQAKVPAHTCLQSTTHQYINTWIDEMSACVRLFEQTG